MPRHPVQPQDDQVETRTLVLYCYGAFELNMFLRLRSGLAARGWSVHVVTHLPSLVLRARRAGIGATLARPPKADTAPAIPLDQTPEGLLGQVTEAQARRFANSAWEAMHRAAASHPLRAVSLMNGLRLGGRITTAFAERHALPKLFVELGNVESKLFVDPEGVNAAARLSRHPEMIDAYDMSDEEIAEWRAGFIARRQAVVAIPQARAQINPWFAFDWIATRLLRIPQPLPLSIRERLVFKVRHVFRWHAPDVKPEGRYIFLPLQVSYDVNLLLFSDYDNLAAIKYAAARASERGVSLVVKPHPAEQDARALAAIRKACEEAGHLMTSFNTADLVLGAEEVVTINSTVGLEARLMGRPVALLGRSLYERFSDRQAAIYAARYLVPFSPFGEAVAEQEAADRIVEMIEAQQP